MMQAMPGHCPMCGMMMGGSSGQSETTPSASQIREQIHNLQQRLDELEHGKVSPQQVQQETPRMCPMCQGMMGGMGGTSSKEQLEGRVEQQVQDLQRRVGELEKGRPARSA